MFTEHLFEGEEENIKLDTLLDVARIGCQGLLSDDFKIELAYEVEKELKTLDLNPQNLQKFSDIIDCISHNLNPMLGGDKNRRTLNSLNRVLITHITKIHKEDLLNYEL